MNDPFLNLCCWIIDLLAIKLFQILLYGRLIVFATKNSRLSKISGSIIEKLLFISFIVQLDWDWEKNYGVTEFKSQISRFQQYQCSFLLLPTLIFLDFKLILSKLLLFLHFYLYSCQKTVKDNSKLRDFHNT